MHISIFPKKHCLSEEIKKRVRDLLKQNFKRYPKNFPSLDLYILRNPGQLSWPDSSLHKIQRWGKITRFGFSREIERYSSQNEFGEYLYSLKQSKSKDIHIYMYYNEIVFINKENRRKKIVYFTFDCERTCGLEGFKEIVAHRCRDAFIKAMFSNFCDRSLLLHAAGIKKGDAGYLFLGGAGFGKSTICNLSKAKGYQILDDDQMKIERSRYGRGFEIYTADNPSIRVKLKYIFFLRKYTKNMLRIMSAKSAIKNGFRNIMDFRKDFFIDFSKKKIDLAIDFLKEVPSYRLYFKKSPTFLRLIKDLENNNYKKEGM